MLNLIAAPPVLELPTVTVEPLVLPTSFAQERLWVVHQLEQMGPTYNVPAAVRLTGPLDADALRAALSEIARRHETLRTAIQPGPYGPVQVVSPPAPVRLRVEDLRALPPAAREAEARRRVQEAASAPFDLARGPLFRVRLVRIEDEVHLLAVCIHHVVSDGWSLAVFFREMGALYAAFRRDEPSPLPEPALQYADYAAWQRERLHGEVLEAEVEWWRAALDGVPATLDLPTDAPRPPVQRHRGALHETQLPRALAYALGAEARRQGGTLFMALLTGFQALLSRYAGQRDLVIGTPVAGRDDEELEGMIGFFVNMLPLRGDLSGDPSFRELLGRVRRATLGAYAHQELPFERLVEALRVERDLSRAPLFQVVFALQNLPATTPRLEGLEFALEWMDTGTAKFDLTVTVVDEGEHLTVAFVYNTDLFSAATMEAMGRRYRRLLEEAVAHPDAPLSAVPLLEPEERERVLVEWNRTARDYPRDRCVHELFEEQAARTPERVAVVCGGEPITYAELNRRANRLARHLLRMDVGMDTRVGVCLERSPELVVAILGILKAGGAYVPLDPEYPRERLVWMLEDTRMPVLVTRRRLADALLPHGPRTVWMDGGAAAFAEEDDTNPDAPCHPLALAYVLYTSGSTGRPKGVMIVHRGVVRLVRETDYARFDDAQVFLQAATPSFDAMTFELWGALLNGACIVVPEAQMPSLERLGRLVGENGVNILWLTAGHFHQMVDGHLEGLRGVRQLLAGGDILSVPHVRKVLQGLPRTQMINGYGPTEVTTFACCHAVEGADDLRASVPIGRPIANTVAYVLDGRMNPVPPGVPGELFLGGDGLARGYFNRPSVTAERFVPDPWSGISGERLYRTGDLVRHRPGGVLEFLGRMDTQVKVRGYRIEPGEVERALQAHPAVRDAVTVVHHHGGAARLVAYLAAEGAAPRPAELREFLKLRLPDYMVPAAFVVLDRLPLNPNGKVDRRALPVPDLSRRQGEDGYAPPRTTTEAVLAEVWSDVLAVERVGIHDNFFELGGYSLLGMRAMSRIRTGFGVELPLRAVFEAPTVAELAARIDRARAGGESAPLPPLVPGGSGDGAPLSFPQERLWFLEGLTPGHPVYNVPVAARLAGPLDARALHGALAEIVRRHEALRTVFPAVGGRALQRVVPAGDLPLPLDSLEDVPAGPEREAALREALQTEAARPFDLAAGPLFRARLLRLGAQEHVLFVGMHHIVSDGWTMGVLFRELSALYSAFLRGEPSPLPPLPVQYGDFARWQRGEAATRALDAQVAWWRDQLAGAPAALELPADRPRPTVPSYVGAVHRFGVPTALVEGVRALARREGVTPYMVLLAAFHALLGRYAGADDVVVGTPTAGRTREEMEALAGFFVNMLAIRVSLSRDPGFGTLLARVREAVLAAHAHQDAPFERVVEALRVPRSLGHAPVVQVMFSFLQDASSALDLEGLRARVEWLAPGTSRFDLSLSVEETAEGLEGGIEYATALFDAETVERFAGHYLRLLAEAVRDPARPVSALSLLDERERARLLAWNRTDAFYRDETLHGLVEVQVRRTPERVAVVFEGERLTYRELNARANRLAHRLRAAGAGLEARVAVCLDRSAELVVALLAVLKAGAAYVPLDPSYPADRVAYMLADSGARVLVTDARLAERAPAGMEARVLVDREAAAIAALPAESPAVVVDPDGLAYVIYTSGSTGRPKGAMNAHRGIVNRLRWIQQHHPLRADDVVLQKTPFSFDVSVPEFFWPLIAGARLAVLAPEAHRDPRRLAATIEREAVTVTHFVPSMLRIFLDDAAAVARCGGLRLVMTSGEALSRELVDRFAARMGVPLLNLYGPTEAAVEVSWWLARPGGAKVPIGVPLANTRLHVLDAALQPLPVGIPGELFIAGVQVGRGYLERPALTAERWLPDPLSPVPGGRMYRTGDGVRRMPDGAIEFLGRTDFQVKVRGYRIELGEIEAALAAQPGVAQAAAAVLDAGTERARIAAWAVPAPGAALDPAVLRAELEGRLPAFMVPRLVTVLDALPLTPSGKLDRRALPAPDEGVAESAAPWEAPASATERVLAALWAEVLEVERVGAEDSFFDRGGHSLLLARLRARVAEETGAELPLVELFQYATPRALAARLESAAAPALAGDGAREREMAAGRDRLRRRRGAAAGEAHGG